MSWLIFFLQKMIPSFLHNTQLLPSLEGLFFLKEKRQQLLLLRDG